MVRGVLRQNENVNLPSVLTVPIAVDRTDAVRNTVLIALPFLLLPAGIWLGTTAAGQLPVLDWWWVMRWTLRAAYVGGAILGWRLGRPVWFYPWFGFAVYEAVATLLWSTPFLLRGLGDRDNWAGTAIPVFALFLLPYAPYFAAVSWVGWRRSQRLLAAYSVFPHAALTLPLFLFVDKMAMLDFAWVETLSSTAAAAVFAVLFWLAPSVVSRAHGNWVRAAVLFGGVLASQLFNAIGVGFEFGGMTDSLVLLIPLTGLGWLILSGPLLLPPILRRLVRLLRAERGIAIISQWGGQLLSGIPADMQRFVGAKSLLQTVKIGDGSSQGDIQMSEETTAAVVSEPRRRYGPNLDYVYKLSIVVLAALAVILVALYVGRAAVYKIHEFERGLHLRGGRFLGVQTPGWHAQIPLVDTVIIVKVIERLGYVERIPAMTSDNVTMDVSLQYTYRVTNPERFALAVDDPERIVFEFVQGRLRDVVNTKAMTGVMNQRAEMNLEIMQVLKEKEDQYGVEFMTVQIQSASPPAEVLSAIKDRMVAAQLQEQAEAEAAQQRIAADAQFYAAQKQADADAYRITATAAAEAEQIRLTTEAQQLAVRAILGELEGKGALAERYIDYLIAGELKENSKWILGTGAEPVLELRPDAGE